MPRRGLTKESIVAAAAQLIEQSGAAAFSMRALAGVLQVKTASLYNHVPSMEALLAEVCVYALHMQRDALMAAIEGKTGPEAIYALADAYRAFASAHRALYQFIISTAAVCGERLREVSQYMVEPFLAVLQETALTSEERLHWQRVLRALLHGFAAQEQAGLLSHLPARVDESFQTAVGCYIDGLRQAEGRR